MFSINIYVRFALIGVCLLGGIILAFVYGFWYAFPFLLVGIVLLIGYILLGTVQSAGMLLQQADIAGAEKRLNMTFKPEWLFGPNRAVYFMLKGTLAINRKELKEGEEWFSKAEAIDMPSDNEAAMIQVQLAALKASKRNWNAAKKHVKKAKDLKITTPEIKAQLAQVEELVKNKGQQRVQMRGKGKGRGGKYYNFR